MSDTLTAEQVAEILPIDPHSVEARELIGIYHGAVYEMRNVGLLKKSHEALRAELAAATARADEMAELLAKSNARCAAAEQNTANVHQLAEAWKNTAQKWAEECAAKDAMFAEMEAKHVDAVQAAEAEAISDNYWDYHAVRCGNCSVEILTRNGSIPNNNALSDTGCSEDEALCGRCAGGQMYTYLDQLEVVEPALAAAEAEAKRLRESLENVKSHVEVGMPTGHHLSAVWNIAYRALVEPKP